MRWLPSLIGVVVIAATHVIAYAEPDNDKQAAKLFEEGRDFAKDGKWPEACAKFQQSNDLVPAVGTQLNLADCLEHRGQLARAQQLFDGAAAADTEKFPARAKMARERADKLGARLVTVVVKLAESQVPAGMTITIAGAPVRASEEVIQLVDPGTIEVVVTAPGRARFAKSLVGTEGRRIVVEVPAAARVDTTVGGGDGKPAVDASRPAGRSRGRVYLAIGVAGAGVLAVVTGEALALSARGAYNDELDAGNCTEVSGKLTCTSPAATARVQDANSKADLATGVVIGGAVLVATGAILYLTAPKKSERRTAIVPTASTRGVGVTLSGSF